jgi:hypothetical protein
MATAKPVPGRTLLSPTDTTGRAKQVRGAYGLGLIYAKTVMGAHASEAAIVA